MAGLSHPILQGMIRSYIYYCLTRTNSREMYLDVLDMENGAWARIIVPEIPPEPVAILPGFSSRGRDSNIMRINPEEFRQGGRKIYHLDIPR